MPACLSYSPVAHSKEEVEYDLTGPAAPSLLGNGTEMVVMVRHLYQKCHLVHADLSGAWVGGSVGVWLCARKVQRQPATRNLPDECVFVC